MNDSVLCSQAEVLAGAIALGEAGDGERDRYRAHLASCGACRQQLGGEREIERTMAPIVQAREGERWEPVLGNPWRFARRTTSLWRVAAAIAAMVLLFIGVRATQTHPRGGAIVRRPSVSAQEERAIAVLNTQTMPRRQHQAESLAVGATLPSSRAVILKVSVDASGVATRCAIAKSSGDAAIDRAVCRAALHVQSVSPNNPK